MLVSEYIADFLEKKGVTDCFTIVGGGSMYLNDSLGHRDRLKCTYFHHEQAAAMAAESYARLEGRVAVVCTTTGPGGTNAITGVLGGWLDSLPMFVLSGQVKYETTTEFFEEKCNGAYKLRSLGDQEYDITPVASHFCKYAVMVKKAEDVRFIMEKAWSLMKTGRPGPVWVDVPVDVQAMDVEPESLRGFEGCESAESQGDAVQSDDEKSVICSEVDKTNSDSVQIDSVLTVSDDTIRRVLAEIEKAQRPVIYAGGGVRISGGYSSFAQMVKKLGVPVCTYWNSIDLMEDEDPLYCGRGGNMGDRAGNFAVQNSDLCIVLGSRLSIRQVGYNYQSWARGAKVIMVDIDRAEMEKHTIHVDMKIRGDVKDFCEKMNRALDGRMQGRRAEAETATANASGYFATDIEPWRQQCLEWKHKYPVVSDKQLNTGDGKPNVYGFLRTLSEKLPEGSLTAAGNGACCVAGHQSWVIKNGTRFIINNAVASMGYGLPAAIGLCMAAGKRETICLEGDGSIMMNLQELQTIITNKLPIKIFLINNEGYHSLRITQNNIFPERSKVGIGPESGDLSFPRFEAVAEAFGYRYFAIRQGKELAEKITEALEYSGACFCEVFTDTDQVWEPKNSARREADGRLTSRPLEDLAPFLPREELTENMYI